MKVELYWAFIATCAAFMVGYGSGAKIASDKKSPIKVEYELEIVDQNTIKMYSHGSKEIFKCPIDSIQAEIEKDNL